VVQWGEWCCAAASDGCKVVVSGGGSGDEWRWVDWCSGYTGAVRGRCWEEGDNDGEKRKMT
jgi:hypothetical protein